MVINNYNYGEFLECCLKSLFKFKKQPFEVIVVDDGSTDNSRQILKGWNEQLKIILKQNGGQGTAYNVGWEQARGDWVMFLDSDDFVIHDLFSTFCHLDLLGYSKVQMPVQVSTIKGTLQNIFFPHFPDSTSPKNVFQWYKNTASYPTPPGSGNIYSKYFLDKVMPLESIWFRDGADGPLLAAAPFYGKIMTLHKPFVAYRHHGRNDCAMEILDVKNISREVKRANKRFRYGCLHARKNGLEIEPDALDKGLSYLQYRACSFALQKNDHPLREDSAGKILRATLKSVFISQGYSIKTRLILSLFILCVLCLKSNSNFLVSLRFIPQKRNLKHFISYFFNMQR